MARTFINPKFREDDVVVSPHRRTVLKVGILMWNDTRRCHIYGAKVLKSNIYDLNQIITIHPKNLHRYTLLNPDLSRILYGSI